MTLIGLTILRCVVHVTLFSLAAALVYFAARRIGPRGGAAALLCGLVLVLGLSVIAASPWPSWRLPSLAVDSAQSAPSNAAPVGRESSGQESAPMAPIGLAPGAAEQTPFTFADYSAAFLDALTQPREINVADRPTWPKWIVIVTGIGVLLSAARLAYGMHGVRRLRAGSQAIEDASLGKLLAETRRRLEIAQPVDLRESSELVTPATLGWRRPAVLLPSGWRDWTDAERRAILAHELAHIAGRDYVAWLVARLAVVVHFYNPLVRWLAGRLQLEQELAADAAAVDVVGDRVSYLQSLASVALATPHHRLAGPARTLIPSRSLLLRRVEMLRSPIGAVKNRLVAARLRWASALVLGVLAVAIAGVRQPNEVFAQQAAGDVDDEAHEVVERIPLEFVPADAVVVASVVPAAIFSHEEFRSLAETVSQVPPLQKADVRVNEVAEIMVTSSRLGHTQRVVLRMTTPSACEKIVGLIDMSEEGKEVAGAELPTWQGYSQRIVKLDALTILFDEDSKANEEPRPLFYEPPWWADEWRAWSDDQVLAVCDVLKLAPDKEKLSGGYPLQMISPLFEKVNLAIAGARIQDGVRIDAVAHADSEESARQVADTAKALITLVKNVLDDQKRALQNRDPARRGMIDKLFAFAGSLLTNSKVEAAGSDATLTYVDDGSGVDVAVTAAVLLPAVEASREAARRNQSLNHLKQLALAIHLYHKTHNRLPAARNFEYYDFAAQQMKRSEHPHSWRVAILPFLEEQALYDAYHFDEPWDSEANKKVLAQGPAVFHDPSDPSPPTSTSYFALVGPDTLFPGDESISFKDVADRTSKTLMLVEQRRGVPWTKPEDTVIREGDPLPEFGGNHPSVFLGARADGSVNAFSQSIDRNVLKAFITRAGGEAAPSP